MNEILIYYKNPIKKDSYNENILPNYDTFKYKSIFIDLINIYIVQPNNKTEIIDLSSIDHIRLKKTNYSYKTITF